MRKTALILCTVLTVLLISCKEREKEGDVIYSEEVAKIVNTVTSGEIQSGDLIEVQFIEPVVEAEEVGSVVKGAFKISPSIRGVAYWKSRNTIVFRPVGDLPYRKTFNGKLILSELNEKFKDENLGSIEFRFRIAGREIAKFDGKLILKNSNNREILQYIGIVSFTESIDLKTVEKALELKKGKKAVEVKITAEPDGKTFNYISGDLLRKSSTDNYTLTIRKKKTGLPKNFKKSFEISPLGSMELTKVSREDKGKSPKIRLHFSDEFDPEQNIDGLIKTIPVSNLKIQRMGSSLIIDGNFRAGENYKLIVEKGIKNRWGTVTEKKYTQKITFANMEPQVEFASSGIFLPSGNQYRLQFHTNNLKRVHVEVKKVYANSIPKFLRNEQLKSLSDRKAPFNAKYVNQVGVIVHNETFEIGEEKNVWKLNEIDLSKLIRKNHKGLYLVRLNFNPRDMLTEIESGNYDKYIEKYGQIYKPLLFSDIGLTCKKIKNNYKVYATDIATAKPMQGVRVKLISIYGDTKSTANTDSDGIATLYGERYFNYYITAEKDGQQSVIKPNDMEWNTSGFDTGGISEHNSGIKAYTYTERGVYRPGDEINISIIARFTKRSYPRNHPLTIEMINPQGKKIYEVTNKQSKDGFYNFKVQTKESDPTGNWRAVFRIGNKEFTHTIKIETVVPYRLKIKIEPEQQFIAWNKTTFNLDLSSTYLFGNPAAGLKARIDTEIFSIKKRFKKYDSFVFTNPSVDFQPIEQTIFEGELDNNGKKLTEWNLPDVSNAPSALMVKVTGKVMEKGGRPNENISFLPYEPYSHYVGIQPPKYHYIPTGSNLEVPAIIVTPEGKPVAGRSLKYRIYRNTEHWWWQYDKKLRFKSDKNTVLIGEGSVNSKTTHSIIKFLPIERGTFLIEVTDEEGTGHTSGIFVTAYKYGSSGGEDKSAGTLELSSQKNKYYTNEHIKVQFPAPKEGIALITVEKGGEILYNTWVSPKGEDLTEVKIPATEKMVPNAYITVSLIQPHKQTENDRPIRMFGILPILVENRDSKHEIEIKTATKFLPEKPFEITLQTKDREPTQFTIAVVDEGLLDITNFKTPDPWPHFFSKVRLETRTFDLFSHIISANKGDVFKTFSIGGDMDYRESQLGNKKRQRRFKPVSLFKGPVDTDASGKAVVRFDMPNYVGSVRIMVIGARKKSYAKAEKRVPVKSELMVMPTLPRVIGPGEKFTVPVSVFAMEDGIGNVEVDIATEELLEIEGADSRKMQFKKADDKECYFTIKAKEQVGQTKVKIRARSAKHKAEYLVDLYVRPASPRIYKSFNSSVESGKTATLYVPDDGLKGTNRATITISNYPGISIDHRLKYLIHYPYGCIEQTTSSVFPQLYIKQFVDYSEADTKDIDKNINAGIQQLRKFQIFSGGFSYWPYEDTPSEWGTLYGGHFMVEAKKLGYHVTEDLYRNWLGYTSKMARQGSGNLTSRVYRAYTLALAGKPANSEMNLLRENRLHKMNNVQKWLLAASYHLAGLPDKVSEIVKDAGMETDNYQEFSGTYGSGLRDKGMILDALVSLNKMEQAEELARDISKYISASDWYSTQTIGYTLLGIGKYITALQKGSEKAELKGHITFADGTEVPFKTEKTYTYRLQNGFGKPIQISLDEKSDVAKAFTTLAWDGVPFKSDIKDENSNLSLNVKWYDEEGKGIDITQINQGTAFWGHFQVENISTLKRVDEVALVQILPSGWEIENTRLSGESMPAWTERMNLYNEKYLDIRDDRVMWFFDIHKNIEKKKKLDFIVKINAVTIGEFELAPTLVEAMYNESFKATKAGKKVKVIK